MSKKIIPWWMNPLLVYLRLQTSWTLWREKVQKQKLEKKQQKLEKKQQELLVLLQPVMNRTAQMHLEPTVQMVADLEVLMSLHQAELMEMLTEVLNSLQPPVQEQISRRLGHKTRPLSRISLDL